MNPDADTTRPDSEALIAAQVPHGKSMLLPPADPPRESALGRTVGLALGWSVINAVATKGMSFVAFAAMGWLLGTQDFGLFALATSIAAFVQIFRDGGVVQLLVQRGQRAYADNIGPVFWMALAFNTTTAVLLAAAAPLLARTFGHPELAPLLWVIAGWNVIATPAVVLAARLQLELRFARLARIAVFSAFIRYGAMIALAASDFGAMSFVLPLPLIAIYEWWATWRTTRDRPWAHPARTDRWRGLFIDSRWLVLVALSTAIINQGTVLVLGGLVTVFVLGVYGFANQLVSQVDALLASTAAGVFFPALSRLKDEPVRQSAAVLRGIRLLTLLSVPVALGLVVGAAAVERLVWGGKWGEAVLPLRIVAAVYVVRILLPLPTLALSARGRFRATAWWISLYGLATAGGAAIGALLQPDAIGIALGFAAGTAGPGAWILLQSCKAIDISRRSVIVAMAPCLALGATAAAAALLLEPSFAYFARAAGQHASGFATAQGAAAHIAARIDTHAGAAVELLLIGGTFATLYGLALRLILPALLAEAIDVLPGFAGRPIRRALWLKPLPVQ